MNTHPHSLQQAHNTQNWAPEFPRFSPARRRAGLAALLLMGSLAAGPAFANKADVTPLAVDESFNAAAVAAKAFDAPDVQALKGMRRVAVPVFAVEFITADNVSASTSGFAAAGRAHSALYIKLLGVGEADFQQITNQLYAQFLAELKASGLEVVEAAQVAASASYPKLVASGKPSPVKSDTSIQVSPTGLPGIYGFAGVGGGNSARSKSVFGALADVGSGFAAVGAITDTVALGKELDASLIEVRLRVNFAQLTDENRGFFGRMASTASTSAKVFPSIDNLMVGVQTGPLRSTLTSKHSLALSNQAFADVREKATTAGDVAGAVALGLLKLATGSKDSHSSKELEVVAEPAAYKQVVGQGLAAATGMVVARISAGR
jgi:hypothetical protein